MNNQVLFSKKVWLLFIFAPSLPMIPVIGYIGYMINYDTEVLEFKDECELNGGEFTFDIPKIMICGESTIIYKEYVGTVTMSGVGS